MGWKVEYKNFERFLNNHSEHLPLKKFKTLQRLNRLKKSKLEKGSESYEAIVLGDEEFIPMALNVSIMIHVGEVEELKKEYNRLSSHYESTNGYLPLHNHEDSFCSIPLREQNSWTAGRPVGPFRQSPRRYHTTARHQSCCCTRGAICPVGINGHARPIGFSQLSLTYHI